MFQGQDFFLHHAFCCSSPWWQTEREVMESELLNTVFPSAAFKLQSVFMFQMLYNWEKSKTPHGTAYGSKLFIFKGFFFRGIVPSIQFFLAYLSLGAGGRPPSLWLPFSFLLRGHSHSQPGLLRGFLLVGHTWNTSPRRCTGVLVRCADHLMWLLLICRSSL